MKKFFSSKFALRFSNFFRIFLRGKKKVEKNMKKIRKKFRTSGFKCRKVMIVLSESMLTMAKSSNKKVIFVFRVVSGTFSAHSAIFEIFIPVRFCSWHLVEIKLWLFGNKLIRLLQLTHQNAVTCAIWLRLYRVFQYGAPLWSIYFL